MSKRDCQPCHKFGIGLPPNPNLRYWFKLFKVLCHSLLAHKEINLRADKVGKATYYYYFFNRIVPSSNDGQNVSALCVQLQSMLLLYWFLCPLVPCWVFGRILNEGQGGKTLLARNDCNVLFRSTLTSQNKKGNNLFVLVLCCSTCPHTYPAKRLEPNNVFHDQKI